jgi:hypothetical protein
MLHLPLTEGTLTASFQPFQDAFLAKAVAAAGAVVWMVWLAERMWVLHDAHANATGHLLGNFHSLVVVQMIHGVVTCGGGGLEW